MNKYLQKISPADRALQSREIGFRAATPVIESVLQSILAMRTEECFSNIIDETKELLTSCLSDFSFEATRKRRRTQAYGNRIITEAVGERSDDITTGTNADTFG